MLQPRGQLENLWLEVKGFGKRLASMASHDNPPLASRTPSTPRSGASNGRSGCMTARSWLA